MQNTLSLASIHILLALASQERHGYDIMKQTTADSLGAVNLGPTTLYTNIKKLVEQDLIEESDERPDPSRDDSRRRYYRLTAKGRAALGSEMARMNRLVHLGQEQHVMQMISANWA